MRISLTFLTWVTLVLQVQCSWNVSLMGYAGSMIVAGSLTKNCWSAEEPLTLELLNHVQTCTWKVSIGRCSYHLHTVAKDLCCLLLPVHTDNNGIVYSVWYAGCRLMCFIYDGSAYTGEYPLATRVTDTSPLICRYIHTREYTEGWIYLLSAELM